VPLGSDSKSRTACNVRSDISNVKSELLSSASISSKSDEAVKASISSVSDEAVTLSSPNISEPQYSGRTELPASADEQQVNQLCAEPSDLPSPLGESRRESLVTLKRQRSSGNHSSDEPTVKRGLVSPVERFVLLLLILIMQHLKVFTACPFL